MTDALDLEPIKTHIEPWRGCPDCKVRELIAEVERLRAENAELRDMYGRTVVEIDRLREIIRKAIQ
jgi:hypothetical protein